MSLGADSSRFAGNSGEMGRHFIDSEVIHLRLDGNADDLTHGPAEPDTASRDT
jgi:hypothetical protein